MERTPKHRVLLVEDEEGLRQTLRLNLELEGYHVTAVATGAEALDRLRGAHFDAAVLDVMLPGMDGFTVCEKARVEGVRTPVLFLTARSTPADRVRGLRTGDDHLAKPFDLEELMLRVSKLVARAEERPPTGVPAKVRFGRNEVDLGAFEARGVAGTRALSQREVMLLRLLIEHAGEVVSREEILHKVWGYDVFPTTRTIDNFIVAFRKLFEEDARHPRHFMSVRGVGYKFMP